MGREEGTMKMATLRNGAVAAVNGGITLVILLIAPMGLAAVMVNTVLVMVASFFVGEMADRVLAGVEQESLGSGKQVLKRKGD
jgi:hypothetical protein